MIWDSLLKIRKIIKEKPVNDNNVIVSITEDKKVNNKESANIVFQINFSDQHQISPKADISINSPNPFSIKVHYNRSFDKDYQQLFESYLPYTLLSHFSKKLHKTFVVSHFAQTLDGRIASVNGDSKWIGNENNLIHAHRMRALTDAVLIGSKTLVTDNPRLTVRHVKGNNPHKIIIGGDKIRLEDYDACKSDIIVFSNNHNTYKKAVKYCLSKKENIYNSKEILSRLFGCGIHSIYLEGGSQTSSIFLKQKSVDQVQIHISPFILGSGITGFNFEGIQCLNEAITFSSYEYRQVGDQMMFIGDLYS